MASYRIRAMRASDIENGFLESLSNLSDVRGLKRSVSSRVLREIRRNPHHKVFVAIRDEAVLGTTTILVEPKFIHDGGFVGHIEDVSVREGFEGDGIGRALVEAAVEFARRSGCYKCILDCEDDVVGFYEGLGFRKRAVEMRLDLR